MKDEVMDNFDIIETALESFVSDVNLRTAQGNRDAGKEKVITAAYEALNRIDEEHDSLQARSDLFEKLTGALEAEHTIAELYSTSASGEEYDALCQQIDADGKILATAQALLKPSVSSGQGETVDTAPLRPNLPEPELKKFRARVKDIGKLPCTIKSGEDTHDTD